MNTDFVGRKFGRLTVVRLDRKEPKIRNNGFTRYWVCRCECGAEEVFQQSMLSGHYVKNCTGCIKSMPPSTKNNPGYLRSLKRDISNLDRGTWSGFFLYFSTFPLMFTSTFERACTEENIKDEYERLKTDPWGGLEPSI